MITFYRHSSLAAAMGVDPATLALESLEWWLRYRQALPIPMGYSRGECRELSHLTIALAKRFQCRRPV